MMRSFSSLSHVVNLKSLVTALDVAIDPERFIASLDLGLTSAGAPLGRGDGETTLEHSDLQAKEAAISR